MRFRDFVFPPADNDSERGDEYDDGHGGRPTERQPHERSGVRLEDEPNHQLSAADDDAGRHSVVVHEHRRARELQTDPGQDDG